MPSRSRIKTQYPGVYYVETESRLTGKPEKVYFIMYRNGGRKVEEKVGGQYKDAMTPSKASHIRTLKITGRLESNSERRNKINERVTLNYLFGIFKENKKHLRSLRDDIGRYNNHIKQTFGNKEVHELKPDMLYRLRNKLLIDHKPATAKQVLGLIQRIVNFCHSMKLCPSLDFKIDMPKFDNTVTEYLTEDEYKRLVRVLDEYEAYHPDSSIIMRIALHTGLRRGMIYGLKWSDIDFERGFIHIRFEEAKSKVSERVPMNSLARAVIKSIAHKPNSEYLFPNRDGRRLHKDAYKRHFQRIRERAGLPDNFRPMYGLRHTFASNLANSGKVDLYTLQKLMTHKSPDMTQRYAHLRDDALQKASEVGAEIHNSLTPLDE